MDTVTPEEVGLSSERLCRIDDAMRRFVDAGQILGAVTLIARRGRVAHFAAMGMMDREAGQPMERDAIFWIASMTKPVTCSAVLMLFEECHFLRDDPVADYLPEFAQEGVRPRHRAGRGGR